MPMIKTVLKQGIKMAFLKQMAKPGPDKKQTAEQLAQDLSTIIDLYIRSALVTTVVIGGGRGATVPHPMVIPVFTVVTGTGIGFLQ